VLSGKTGFTGFTCLPGLNGFTGRRESGKTGFTGFTGRNESGKTGFTGFTGRSESGNTGFTGFTGRSESGRTGLGGFIESGGTGRTGFGGSGGRSESGTPSESPMRCSLTAAVDGPDVIPESAGFMQALNPAIATTASEERMIFLERIEISLLIFPDVTENTPATYAGLYFGMTRSEIKSGMVCPRKPMHDSFTLMEYPRP
jgi:hypothetical protein